MVNGNPLLIYNLTGTLYADVLHYEDFKAKYKQCCLNNFSRLNFFGLSIPKKPREIELYELFVKPTFSIKIDEVLQKSFQTEIFDEEISQVIIENEKSLNDAVKRHFIKVHTSSKNDLLFQYLFSVGDNVVILGSPGAGKSSLIKYAICKIVEEDKEAFTNDEVYYYLPIRLELHKYNRFKKLGKGGILEYMVDNLKDEFQLPVEKKKAEFFLSNFPTLVFFDGLDEIFDVQERVDVRNDIENFIRNNKIAKSIVTSRYESYEEVRLNTSLFKAIDVLDFDKKQIKEYVNKWYNIEEVNEYVREQEKKKCIEQLKDADDELKQNPLLLSLILILFRNEQGLPTSKLEIYEGCAQTLVDTRDRKEKKLDLELVISNKIAIFSNIAYWQFLNEIEKKESKVDYNGVKNFIAKHLIDKGEFEDQETADNAAKQFLDYAKLRSIYFENKFTHKTFYEYFTAYFIYINFYTKSGNWEKLQKIICDNIGVASWHVIIELLISKIDQNQFDFEVIDKIVELLLDRKPEVTSYFFSSLLKHLQNISPSMSRSLISRMIFYLSDAANLTVADKLILKNYFENVCSLIKIKKYKDSFVKIIEAKLSEKKAFEQELYNLLYEIYRATKEKDVKVLLDECSSSNEDFECKAKNFLLQNLDDLFEKAKMNKLFESFYKAFGAEGVVMTFESYYGQAIFNGHTKFNWVIHLINQTTSVNELTPLYEKFTSIGLKQKDIRSVLRANSRLLSVKIENLIGGTRLKSDPKSKTLSPLNEMLLEVVRYTYVVKHNELTHYFTVNEEKFKEG